MIEILKIKDWIKQQKKVSVKFSNEQIEEIEEIFLKWNSIHLVNNTYKSAILRANFK